jgi:hypothetical protein
VGFLGEESLVVCQAGKGVRVVVETVVDGRVLHGADIDMEVDLGSRAVGLRGNYERTQFTGKRKSLVYDEESQSQSIISRNSLSLLEKPGEPARVGLGWGGMIEREAIVKKRPHSYSVLL